jgi:hypothetical protein
MRARAGGVWCVRAGPGRPRRAIFSGGNPCRPAAVEWEPCSAGNGFALTRVRALRGAGLKREAQRHGDGPNRVGRVRAHLDLRAGRARGGGADLGALPDRPRPGAPFLRRGAATGPRRAVPTAARRRPTSTSTATVRQTSCCSSGTGRRKIWVPIPGRLPRRSRSSSPTCATCRTPSRMPPPSRRTADSRGRFAGCSQASSCSARSRRSSGSSRAGRAGTGSMATRAPERPRAIPAGVHDRKSTLDSLAQE